MHSVYGDKPSPEAKATKGRATLCLLASGSGQAGRAGAALGRRAGVRALAPVASLFCQKSSRPPLCGDLKHFCQNALAPVALRTHARPPALAAPARPACPPVYKCYSIKFTDVNTKFTFINILFTNVNCVYIRELLRLLTAVYICAASPPPEASVLFFRWRSHPLYAPFGQPV